MEQQWLRCSAAHITASYRFRERKFMSRSCQTWDPKKTRDTNLQKPAEGGPGRCLHVTVRQEQHSFV